MNKEQTFKEICLELGISEPTMRKLLGVVGDKGQHKKYRKASKEELKKLLDKYRNKPRESMAAIAREFGICEKNIKRVITQTQLPITPREAAIKWLAEKERVRLKKIEEKVKELKKPKVVKKINYIKPNNESSTEVKRYEKIISERLKEIKSIYATDENELTDYKTIAKLLGISYQGVINIERKALAKLAMALEGIEAEDGEKAKALLDYLRGL